MQCSESGDTVAEADPVLLGQVVWNLLDNAIRFTPSGGTIRIRTDGDAEEVTLSVEDTGAGFPGDVLDKIFDRFFRADRARRRAEAATGTGLGLSIVKAEAEAHGGVVEAGNLLEGGARVAVRFPRQSAARS